MKYLKRFIRGLTWAFMLMGAGVVVFFAILFSKEMDDDPIIPETSFWK